MDTNTTKYLSTEEYLATNKYWGIISSQWGTPVDLDEEVSFCITNEATSTPLPAYNPEIPLNLSYNTLNSSRKRKQNIDNDDVSLNHLFECTWTSEDCVSDTDIHYTVKGKLMTKRSMEDLGERIEKLIKHNFKQLKKQRRQRNFRPVSKAIRYTSPLESSVSIEGLSFDDTDLDSTKCLHTDNNESFTKVVEPNHEGDIPTRDMKLQPNVENTSNDNQTLISDIINGAFSSIDRHADVQESTIFIKSGKNQNENLVRERSLSFGFLKSFWSTLTGSESGSKTKVPLSDLKRNQY